MNCELLCELSKHHEIMDYDDNAAPTTARSLHLGRSVKVPAPAHTGLIPESGLSWVFSSSAKGYLLCLLQLHIICMTFPFFQRLIQNFNVKVTFRLTSIKCLFKICAPKNRNMVQ